MPPTKVKAYLMPEVLTPQGLTQEIQLWGFEAFLPEFKYSRMNQLYQLFLHPTSGLALFVVFQETKLEKTVLVGYVNPKDLDSLSLTVQYLVKNGKFSYTSPRWDNMKHMLSLVVGKTSSVWPVPEFPWEFHLYHHSLLAGYGRKRTQKLKMWSNTLWRAMCNHTQWSQYKLEKTFLPISH